MEDAGDEPGTVTDPAAVVDEEADDDEDKDEEGLVAPKFVSISELIVFLAAPPLPLISKPWPFLLKPVVPIYDDKRAALSFGLFRRLLIFGKVVVDVGVVVAPAGVKS